MCREATPASKLSLDTLDCLLNGEKAMKSMETISFSVYPCEHNCVYVYTCMHRLDINLSCHSLGAIHFVFETGSLNWPRECQLGYNN